MGAAPRLCFRLERLNLRGGVALGSLGLTPGTAVTFHNEMAEAAVGIVVE